MQEVIKTTAIEVAHESEIDWLKSRSKGVTSSDMALIMGDAKARSFDKKYRGGAGLNGLAERKRGDIQIEEPSIAMRLGHAVEPLIGERFQEEHPDAQMFRPARTTIFMHAEHQWLRTSLDFCAYEESVWAPVEAKFTSMWMHDPSLLVDALGFFQWQCRTQMAVMGWSRCWLRWIQRFPRSGHDPEGEHLYERDMEIEEEMIRRAQAFHEAVVGGKKVNEEKIYAGF